MIKPAVPAILVLSLRARLGQESAAEKPPAIVSPRRIGTGIHL